MAESLTTKDEKAYFEPANFTQVPNKLFKVMEEDRTMSDAELRVMLVVIRQTKGWGKEKDWIAFSQFIKKTGLSRPSVAKGIKEAMRRGWLLRFKHGHSFMYAPKIRVKKINS